MPKTKRPPKTDPKQLPFMYAVVPQFVVSTIQATRDIAHLRADPADLITVASYRRLKTRSTPDRLRFASSIRTVETAARTALRQGLSPLDRTMAHNAILTLQKVLDDIR